MRKKWNALLATMLCVMLTPVLTAEGGNEKPVFFQLVWQSDNVKGTVFINGFAIAELQGMSGSGSAALNVWLTGNNELRADIKKADPSQEASFTMGVSKKIPGDMVDTTEKGGLFSLEKKNPDFAGGKSVVLARKFKSDLDFSAHLNSGRTADEKDVIAYAVKIHQLYMKKDKAAIMKEFSVKTGDYAKAFSHDGMAAEFESALNEMLKEKLEKIDPSKLRTVKAGPGGCVWHVLEGDGELIRMNDAEGNRSEIAVYVAVVNGALKVIR